MTSLNSFWFGMLVIHVFYGLVFVAIASKYRGSPPTLLIGLVVVFLWPVIIHYSLMNEGRKRHG